MTETQVNAADCRVLQIVLSQFRDYLTAKGLQASSRNNYRFHMAMTVAASLGVKKGDADSLAQLDLKSVTKKSLDAAFVTVQKEFKAAMKSGQTEDQAAKSPESHQQPGKETRRPVRAGVGLM